MCPTTFVIIEDMFGEDLWRFVKDCNWKVQPMKFVFATSFGGFAQSYHFGHNSFILNGIDMKPTPMDR